MSIKKKKKTEKSKRNSLEEMDERVIEHAQVDNLSAFFAALINYALIIATTVVLFFAASYPIMRNDSKYLAAERKLIETRETYSTTYPSSGMTFEKMQALENFYFGDFKEDIQKEYNETNETDFSIIHIFNIVVCQLPVEPTPTEYSTTYFSYVLDDQGVPMVDSLAISKYDDLGKRGKEDLAGIIQSAYTRLEVMLRQHDSEFKAAVDFQLAYDAWARIIPYFASLVIVFLILPIFFKHGASLGEKIFHLAYANKRSGYAISWWKLPLKMIIYGALGTMAAYLFYPHFFLIFAVFPYFLNAIIRLFSPSRRGIPEKLLFIVPVDTNYEKLYRNEAELLQDGETMLASYSDPAYTATLSSVETISMEDRGDGAH